MAAPNLSDLLAFYNQINQYGQANGMTLSLPMPGLAEYRMRIRSEHLSSPGTAHGGVLAGLMDAVLGAAALSLAFTTGELVSTVEFKINYFRPAHLGDELVAQARVDHAGRSLLVASGTVCLAGADGIPGPTVAQGLGTFNRYPAAKRQLRPDQ